MEASSLMCNECMSITGPMRAVERNYIPANSDIIPLECSEWLPI